MLFSYCNSRLYKPFNVCYNLCQNLNRYIDEDQLVVNMKKVDNEMKWPDLMESWDSLTEGIVTLLKGTSIFIVGNSTEINQKVANKLASGIGYTLLFSLLQ